MGFLKKIKIKIGTQVLNLKRYYSLSIDMDHHQERHMFHSFTIVSLQAKCAFGGMILLVDGVKEPHKEHVAKAYEIKLRNT